MNINIIRALLQENPALFLEAIAINPIEIASVSYDFINDYIAFPIITATIFDRAERFVPIMQAGVSIGYIFLTRNNEIAEDDMPTWLYTAYLTDVEETDFHNGRLNIKKDYVVIAQPHFQEYKQSFYETSPIWGNFFHEESASTLSPATKTITQIELKNSKYPTNWHKETAIRAIQQPYVFERFLKKYHLLELLFDWKFASDITREDKETTEGLKRIITLAQNYGKGEDIARLNAIITAYCSGKIPQLVSKLNQLEPYSSISEQIFFIYGKESNPFGQKDFADFWNCLSNHEHPFGFSLENLIATNLLPKISNYNPQNPNLEQEQQKQQAKYHKELLKFTAYCIYRIRSSIAHHKIGEYLMTHQDEAFMINFAEPLIDEVISHCFKTDVNT